MEDKKERSGKAEGKEKEKSEPLMSMIK